VVVAAGSGGGGGGGVGGGGVGGGSGAGAVLEVGLVIGWRWRKLARTDEAIVAVVGAVGGRGRWQWLGAGAVVDSGYGDGSWLVGGGPPKRPRLPQGLNGELGRLLLQHKNISLFRMILWGPKGSTVVLNHWLSCRKGRVALHHRRC